ncbi:MAG: transcriptional regulator [Coriobacteriia bacterium]|nr:MAG: transcriptional regulator [Coriobacteriia bacterium]
MDERITEELLAELLASPSIEGFLDENAINEVTLSEYLQQLLDKKGLKRAEVIRKANLNATFGYQVFTGARGAGRDTILQLVFAMELTLREANRLLQAAGVNGLYCKNRRDGIIIFCIEHSYSLQETDEELYRFGEETIC